MMKRIILVCMLMLMGLFIGCGKNNKQTNNGIKKPLMVKVEQATTGTLTQTLHYKGTVSPWKQANIQPDSSGRIGKIYVKQGDIVKENQLLAELDTTTLKLQLKQAQAALAVAKASFNDAQLNFDRISTLFKKQAISQMQYEKAQLNLEAATTGVQSTQATVDVIQHTLDNSYMKAPFAGIIAAKNQEEGDMINPMMGMSSSVLTLMDLTKVKIELTIPSEDVEKIKPNQPCYIHLSSLPGEEFKGEVYSKNLAADPVSKTFKVEIKMDNPHMKVKPGVFADVDVEIKRIENALVVPVSAVIDEKFVMIADKNQAKKRDVTVGDKNDTFYQILSGLTPGERVIIEGNYDLKDQSEIVINGENHENR